MANGDNPVAGHATQIYIEVDPVGVQGTFTLLPECTSSIDHNVTRENTEITPHGANVDSYIVSQVKKRAEVGMDITYKFNNSVHAALHAHYYGNVVFGVMIVGPEGTAPGTDTVIESGQLVSFAQMSPVRNGEYKVTASFRPSGAFKVNGTLYS
jgi:hypothetical protein